jgi:glycerol-3-phosphate acyltransferase PlsY
LGSPDAIVILLLAAVAGYLCGSVPYGLLLTRAAGLGDIRGIGSGNIGATNVLRTGNKRLAAATLLLDMAKGALPALLAARYGTMAGLAAGVAAVVGHNFPVWLRFRGGKGVATTLGVLTAWAWPVGLLTAAAWLAVSLAFRYSSLAALVALALAPLWMALLSSGPATVAAAALALLAVVRHRDNIRRLRAGRESRIGDKPGRSAGP